MCFTYKLFYNSNISTYIMDRLQIFIPNFFSCYICIFYNCKASISNFLIEIY